MTNTIKEFTTENSINAEELQVLTALIKKEQFEDAVIHLIDEAEENEIILKYFLNYLVHDKDACSDFVKVLIEILYITIDNNFSICQEFEYIEFDNIDIYTLSYYVCDCTAKIYLYNNEMYEVDEVDECIINGEEAVHASGFPDDLTTHTDNVVFIDGDPYLDDTRTHEHYEIHECDQCGDVTFNYCEDCHEDEENNGDYFEYSSGYSPKIYDAIRDNPTGKPKILIGFEIEKNDEPTDYFCKYDLKDNGYIIEEDSSVSNGFELITPAFPLYDDEALSDLENYEDFINVENIQGAGGHVNLSKAHTNTNQFYDEICYTFAPLLFAMYHGRLNNVYSRAYNKERMKTQRGAIKLKHNGIVELRLITAVKDLDNLKFRIKLFQILLKLSEAKKSHLFIFLELNRDSELKRHLSAVYTKEKIKKVSELSLKMWQDYFSPLANQNA